METTPGETSYLGRADYDGWEGYVGDVQGLSGGGDRAVPPVCHGLVDHQAGHAEPTDHHHHPEQPGELVGGGDVDQAVDRRGLQELFQLVHSKGTNDK